ncbi:hypothetical protein [Bradyrhizobium sp. SZCCHNS2015]|uniref:hypothetical protein n=1 Tax=Bradyrhizobium sp. SZCCHNS2015 TaxID=3057305 RepID=UPI0028ED7B72|nr:hypothetical protein [Bradyrhizobium sp. SZCCHNS2015]
MFVLLVVAAMIWGALSALSFLQTITSFVAALIFLSALLFSGRNRGDNALGCSVMIVQTAFFGVLFLGGNWISSLVIDYVSVNAASIAGLIAFVAGCIFFAREVPGRLLLTRLTAFDPMFAMMVNRWPRGERVTLAKRYQRIPTSETLTEIYRQSAPRS